VPSSPCHRDDRYLALRIWHETYAIQDASRHAGACETMYVNMPAFGLGKAGLLEKAQGKRNTARGRLGAAATGN
jgi:hypothetical protein